MIIRNGFVLCEITGEYPEDWVVTPIAYSDNQFELEQEIVRLNLIVEIEQNKYDSLLSEATNLIFDLNSKLDLALVDYDKELKFEEEIPVPEVKPKTGTEHKNWKYIKDYNYQVNCKNANLRNNKKLEITNGFREKNGIPTHLKEIVRFSEFSYTPQFLIRTRPKLSNYEIRSFSETFE